MLVQALNVESKAGGEIFLVPEHDVDIGSNAAVDLLRSSLTALALP